ncbi:hypothetical protein E2C01_021866 [Portunus trituberculatus]|uniref:Uncharacterized protein n=1 Tax=Portunus trituberculatus TaxID=210409 RepID=A0A5B7E5Q8_PORTR|nr:hypothetical protein [Portunus trituberculatus]
MQKYRTKELIHLLPLLSTTHFDHEKMDIHPDPRDTNGSASTPPAKRGSRKPPLGREKTVQEVSTGDCWKKVDT